MISKRERGLYELYAEDSERADALAFGRRPMPDRRGFLKGAGLATLGALVGGTIPFSRSMPSGFIPAALAQATAPVVGKDGLVTIQDRPFNAETPAHLLDDEVTPTNRHFIRNNGVLPAKMDAADWKLVIDGEVNTPLTLTIDELKRRFTPVALKLQLECAGNGRAFFNPPAAGNQWTYGAVGCAEWTGVRLADVLKAAGVKPSAVYTGHYGADVHVSGNPTQVVISRGVPIAKALDPNNLIAWAMNGTPIHPQNGAPLRLVIPGWAGSVSQKWVTRVWVRDKVHDGARMTGLSYKKPVYPVKPGQEVPEADFAILGSMPVKSLITFPAAGITVPAGNPTTEVRGQAWAGDRGVTAVDVSIDFGATWRKAALKPAANKFAWQRWSAQVKFPSKGYYEVWARATDEAGVAQPFAVAWNPEGYTANAMHRVAVTVA